VTTTTQLTFDKTITLGNILVAIVVGLSILGSALHIGNRITALEVKVEAMWLIYQADRNVLDGHRK